MRTLFRCDHLPFLQKGIPGDLALRRIPSEDITNRSDTVDRLDFDKMARAVRLTVDAVSALASTAPPPRFRYPAGAGTTP